ncbi:hypothetical protein V6N13_031790 [Hibiscus sabdariffa]|uniref:Uncharacterized protein n=1 Tax=Hibiscus sabdariffa TaxID=183260 RepID=A0ABR2AGK8_9ROSI
MNPNLSLKLLVSLAPAALQNLFSSSSSSSSLEHSTSAVKNGSFLKLSAAEAATVEALEVFFRVSRFPKMFFLEVGGGVAGGGSGSNLMDSFFLWFCSFFGIPGKRSQENGTPENRTGAAGLSGESSWKYEDPSEDDNVADDEDDGDDEEKEGVRREEGYLVAESKESNF